MGNNKNLEEVLTEHFDPKKVEVEQVEQHSIDALGISLSNEQIAKLSGAPSGSTVKTSVIQEYSDESKKNNAIKEENVPGGLLLTVTNKDYIGHENKVIIYTVESQEENNLTISFGIYIKLTDFLPNGKAFKGLGAYFIAVIVRAAKELDGCKEIRLQAAGGRSWNDRDNNGSRWYGYITWPRYGFDMDLPETTTSMIKHFQFDPASLSGCKRVSDVLSLKLGNEFWKVVGDGWDMVFDLTNNSSIKVLSKFLGEEV